MNINDYINPVSLEKPDAYYFSEADLFGKHISINTPDNPVHDLSDYNIALLGIPEDRNAYQKGSSLAPDKIRSQLYMLYQIAPKLKIVDLGNLKQGNTFTDTYYALKEVIAELLNNRLRVALLGGTQDLTVPVFQALEKDQEKVSLVVIDSRIDINKDTVNINSDSFLNEILLKKNKLFQFVNVGHQSYLTHPKNVDLINNLFYNTFRIGQLRANLHGFEPTVRNAHIASLDIGAVRSPDAPGQSRPSPNGLYAEEICQLAKYCGTSDQLSIFGVFEYNPKNDVQNQTAILIAQIVWYFIEGCANRIMESPSAEGKNFKTFIVGHGDMDHDITFFKSSLTDRWWMSVPHIKTDTSVLIGCSVSDYDMACNHEIPDLWWKTFQKLN
jgi:arginase family enzyme